MARTGSAGWILFVTIACATLVRFSLLRFPRLWYDEATTGVMGLAVLRGQFPVYFFGQPFMGAFDAYLAAPLYLLFGVSARTLELLPVLLSVVWLALMARLALEAFGPRAALFSLLVLVVPPDYLLNWSHEARTHYVLLLPLGTLALILAFRAVRLPPRRARLAFGILGGVLGLAFWTNFLAVTYLPVTVALVVWLRPSGAHLRSALAAVPGFFLGSLPHWLYGFGHGSALPDVGRRPDGVAMLYHVRGLAETAWPRLVGVPGEVRGTALEGTLSVGLAALYGVALVHAVRGARGDGTPGRAAGRALVLLVVVNVGLAVGTQYGEVLTGDARYLLPLYVALPLLLGHWLGRLASRRLALVLAGALVVVHAAGALSGEFGNLRPSVAAAERAELERHLALVAALERQGVRRLYGHFDQRKVTFLSAERVIVSDPYAEINPYYARAVDGAEQAAWGIGRRDSVLEQNLRALGIGFTFRPVTGPANGVYQDFTLRAEAVRELDPSAWRVTTSHHSELSEWLVDRDASTVWRSGQPLRGDEWVQFDLGRVERVALVRWLPGRYQEVPVGVALEGSLDGSHWERLLDLTIYQGPLYWSAGRPMARVRSGRVELRIPPRPVRHLRVLQTGRGDGRFEWSVQELFVYAATGMPAPTLEASGPQLAAGLRAAGVTRLYADHGWGSRVALAAPEIRVLPANRALDTAGFEGPGREFVPRVRWRPGTGVLVEPMDADGFARAARGAGFGFTSSEVAGLRLFVHASRPGCPGLRLPSAELRVTGAPRPEIAARAIDGDKRTAWTTAETHGVESWFRVDLRTPRSLRAVQLQSGDLPAWSRGLRLEGSNDGVTWRQLAAETSTEGPRRWGGIVLLRDGLVAVRLDFAPTTLSALRLAPASMDWEPRWSIGELSVFAESTGARTGGGAAPRSCS
jgi:hypothetical protein